jgi:hypothetical protein
MITSETPYKLAEIIRDTWPQLYRPSNLPFTEQKNLSGDSISEKKPPVI